MSEEKKIYNVKEVQAMLGVSRQAVYELLRREEFSYVVVAGRYCISKESFDNWLDHNNANTRGKSRCR